MNAPQRLIDGLVEAREEFERPTLYIDDFTITLGLAVDAVWRRGFLKTESDPEECPGYEIRAVYNRDGKNIMDLFSEDDLVRLEKAMLD